MKTSNKLSNKRPNSHLQSAKSATLGNLVSPVSRVRTQLELGGNGARPSGLLSASTSIASDRARGSNVKLDDDGVEASDSHIDTDTKGPSRGPPKYRKVRLCRVSGFGPNTGNVHHSVPSQPIGPAIPGPFQGSWAPHSATFASSTLAPVPVSGSHAVLHQPPFNLAAAVSVALNGTAVVDPPVARIQDPETSSIADGGKPPRVPQIIMPSVMPPTGIAPTPNGGTRPSTPEPEPLVDDLGLGVSTQQAGSSKQEADPSLHIAPTCLPEKIQPAPVEARTQSSTTEPQLLFYDLGRIADESQDVQAGLSSLSAPVTQPLASTTQGILYPNLSHTFGSTEFETMEALSTGYASGFSAPWHSSSTTSTYSSTQGMAPQQGVQMDLQEPCSSDNISHTTVSGPEISQMSRDTNSYTDTDMDVGMDLCDAPTNTAPTSTQQWDVPSSNFTGQIQAPVDVVHSWIPFSTPVYQPGQSAYDVYSQVQVNQTSLFEPVPSIGPYQLDALNMQNYFSYNQGYGQGTTNAFPENAVAAHNQAFSASGFELTTSWPNYHQGYPVEQPAFPTQEPLLYFPEPCSTPQTSYPLPPSSITQNHLMAHDQSVDQQLQCNMSAGHTSLSVDVRESPSTHRDQSSLASSAEASSVTLNGKQPDRIRPSSGFSSSSETDAGAHRVLYSALPEVMPSASSRDFSLVKRQDDSKGCKPPTRIYCSLPKRPRPRTMVFRAPDAHISTRAVPDRNPRVKLARETTAPTTQPAKRNRDESDDLDEEGPTKRRRVVKSSVAPARTASTSPRLSRSVSQKSCPRSARTCTDIIGRLVRQMVRTWW